MLSLDASAAEAWLTCRRAGRAEPECARASATRPAGRVAAVAEASFSTRPSPPKPPPASWVAELLGAMRGWRLAPLGEEVGAVLPRPIALRARLLVVANGHPMGDAYVRRVRFGEAPGEAPTLAEDGEPVIVLNALLLAPWHRDWPVERRSLDLQGLLRHELFHVAFHRYRESAPSWRRLARRSDPTARLLTLVLDEGVAHLLDRGATLAREGFPLAKASPALVELDAALRALRDRRLSATATAELLGRASEGPYWKKYGSISGLLLAHGVQQRWGQAGLRRALACGPGRLVALYQQAVRTAGLPPAPPALRAAAAALDACPGARGGN